MTFKFHFDVKKAMVILDIETDNLDRRLTLWEKLESLKAILTSDEYLPEAVFEDFFTLDNGKEVSRVFVVKNDVSIHNKNTWQETMVFLSESMHTFEEFFNEFSDILKS